MNRKIHLSGAVILLLYMIFAIFTLALTAASASVYESITRDMEQSFEARTAMSYISTKLRQSDRAAAQNDMLITEEEGCVSRIYFYNGTVTEYYGEAETEFAPDMGNEIIKAENFTAHSKNGRIFVNIRINGEDYPLIFSENR